MVYTISSSALKNSTCSVAGFNVFLSQDCNYFKSEDAILVLEGFVYDLDKKSALACEEIVHLVQNCILNKAVFPAHITGQYNVIYADAEQVFILNDFAGNLPLFYSEQPGMLISNAEITFSELDYELDAIGIAQSVMGPSHCTQHNRTHFKDVKRLLPGQYLLLHKLKKNEVWIDSMVASNLRVNSKKERVALDNLLKENAQIYFRTYKHVVLPVSGGVDSRITLSACKPLLNNENAELLSYGPTNSIDNRIGRKLAKYLGLAHTDIDFEKRLFVPSAEIEKAINNGAEFYLNVWFSVINWLEQKGKPMENSVLLLGDVFDLLRAKNVRSLRSRKKRTKNAFIKALGILPKLSPLQVDVFTEAQLAYLKHEVAKFEKDEPQFFQMLSLEKELFLKETEKDIRSFVHYIIEKNSPPAQENLEEAYFAFTWGRRAMARQASIFKGTIPAYIAMTNRHLLKHLLNIHPWDRIEDSLTHKLLRLPQNRDLANFETAQIPFMPYKRPMAIKYAAWGMRFLLDRIIIKMQLKGWIKKERLVQHIDYHKYYLQPENEQNLKTLVANQPLGAMPLAMFNNRKTKKQRSFTEADINAFVYPVYLMAR